MSKKKYLYGASVQGIQKFIFSTNKLKDIVGASELVENICTILFDDYRSDGAEGNVVSAAGNIKYIFSREEDCRRAVLEFPRKVTEYAPGITISQAVVPLTGNNFCQDVNLLETKLRAQRNRRMQETQTGLMAVERARNTGNPAVQTIGGEFMDEGTLKKRERGPQPTFKLAEKFGFRDVSYSNMAFYTDKLTNKNDWVAVVHADGNGLGAVVAKKGGDKEAFHKFSSNLDKATQKAAQEALRMINEEDYNNSERREVEPIRPIVLGGDDLTIICSADIAMRFTRHYLENFEKYTKEIVGDKLTACAGIAYVKSAYPFYYAVDMAEALCSEAKKDSKEDARKKAHNGEIPASLMFHKVQSSFIEDYEEIKRKELTPCPKSELTLNEEHTFCFGPYYLHEEADRWTIDQLRDTASIFENENANPAKSAMREWAGLMSSNVEKAEQKRKRVHSIEGEKNDNNPGDAFNKCTNKNEKYKRGRAYAYPAYDVLALLTVENQITKEERK